MAKSWTSTLRLPKSTFPPRPLPELRPLYLQRTTDDFYRWQEANRPVISAGSGKSTSAALFEIHDGPPYANGSLHVGHALNKILKDIILRVKVQQGRRVRYVPGWDCHGLPIELKALAESSSSSSSSPSATSSPLAIRTVARELATSTVLAQMAEFRSFGVMADWDARWTTMDPEYELRQLRLFQKLVRGGFIYRRYKPVYWSPSSRTALAEAELEYNDRHRSITAFVRFPIVEGGSDLRLPGYGSSANNRRLFAVIWTTTPWTLPANEAIAVHRDLDYAIVQRRRRGGAGYDDAHLLVAESCLDAFAGACHADRNKGTASATTDDDNTGTVDSELTVVARSIRGADLLHLHYTNPLRGPQAPPQPLLHADFVTGGSGSGLVHMAPGHGFDDYEVCTAHDLPVSVPVDDAGCFTADAYPPDPARLQGLSVQGAGGTAVLAMLAAEHAVVATHALQHKYPYDWRTKQPIVIRATAQWFADVGLIKKRAVASLKAVRFVPPAGHSRLSSFVQGRSEWCISRQRAWGVPIPALHYEASSDASATDAGSNDSGGVVLTPESVAHVVDVLAERGTDAWWSDAPDDPAWISPALRAAHPGVVFRRGTDTMDVWFDSGCSWTQMATQADVYLEGTDQHRGWFQSSLLTRVAALSADTTKKGKAATLAPFRTLVTHGFMLDGEGKKMSKSLGNIVTGAQVMDGTLLPPLKPRRNKVRGKNKTLASASSNAGSGSGGPASPAYDALGPDALRLWVASSDYTGDVVMSEAVLQATHTALVKYRVLFKMLLGSMRPPVPASREPPLTTLDRLVLLQLQDTMAEVAGHYERFEFARAIASLNRWAAHDLSALYLESAKDRLYCAGTDDDAAATAVLVPLFLGLARMLAPVVPMLVEEAWDHAPAWLRETMPHPLHQLYEAPLFIDKDPFNTSGHVHLRAAVPALYGAHAAVRAALEEARAAKVLGSSLQCAVVLQVGEDNAFSLHETDDRLRDKAYMESAAATAYLRSYADDLATLFVVSSVTLTTTAPSPAEPGAWRYQAPVQVNGHTLGTAWVLPPEQAKCPRCWRYVAPAEDTLCGRCEEAVRQQGETEV